jgi:glycosyltransferase involved in cell wall biosynthesis
MKTTKHIFSDENFISICILTFCRPYYLKRLLDSLDKHADMPYEVIVHDDGSREDFRKELYELHDRISVTITHAGLNMGIPVSANRAISLAQSKYVLFLNDDIIFNRPCLQEICNTLEAPFIGFYSPMNGMSAQDRDTYLKRPHCSNLDTKYIIAPKLGGGSSIAFRKEVWQEVGGFSEECISSQSDNVFIFKMLKAGYFKGFVLNEPGLTVEDPGGKEYKGSVDWMQGRDCSYPKLFKMPPRVLDDISLARQRWNYYWTDGERTIDIRGTPAFPDTRPNPIAGLNDIPYWGTYWDNMLGSNPPETLDWKLAEKHGQDKWQEEIQASYK